MDVNGMLKDALTGLQDAMLTHTAIGDPIKIGDYTLIPLSSVNFGFGGGGGGGEGTMAKQSGTGSGQGMGGGFAIQPVGFIVAGPNGIQLLSIDKTESHPSSVKGLTPKIVDAIKDIVAKKTTKSEGSTEGSKD